MILKVQFKALSLGLCSFSKEHLFVIILHLGKCSGDVVFKFFLHFNSDGNFVFQSGTRGVL